VFLPSADSASPVVDSFAAVVRRGRRGRRAKCGPKAGPLPRWTYSPRDPSGALGAWGEATCSSGAHRPCRCCYNCGKPGHGSVSCDNPPHCPICASKGKVARHRAGSVVCSSIPPVGRAVAAPLMPPPSRPRTPRSRASSGGARWPIRGPLRGRQTQVGRRPPWT